MVISSDKNSLDVNLDCDVKQFLQAVEKADYERAQSIYRGPFLKNLRLNKLGPELEEWVYGTREVLGSYMGHMLLALANQEGQAGRFAEAAKLAIQAYELSIVPEPEHFKQLYLLMRAGASPYVERLKDEAEGFDLELNVTTQEAQRLVVEGATAERGAFLSGLAPDSKGGRRAHQHLLYSRTTFVGRKAELAELDRHFLSGDERLITIIGPGGSGKSRLALEFAQTLVRTNTFQDGVFFISLDAHQSADLIGPAIVEALDLDLPTLAEPVKHVAQCVGDKRLLLVLDNFEQLVEVGGTDKLAFLLHYCLHLRLLVTSRQRLMLSEENLVELRGLPYIQTDKSPSGTEPSEAARLFLQRAKGVYRKNSFTPTTLGYIEKICEAVSGSPLAIELAAAWVNSISIRDIASEIALNLDLFTTTRSASDRHQSLRATFEHSWQLLSEKEQTTLRNLSVFSGGFRRGAAAEIAGATLSGLASLVNKSLLWLSLSGRYEHHPLLQRYTKEKLEEHPNEHARLEREHSIFYLRLLQSSHDSRAGYTTETLVEDLENIASAWRTAVLNREVELLAETGSALVEALAKRPLEAISLLSSALSAVRELPESIKRTALELSLEVALGSPLMSTYGYAAEEVERNFTSARKHCSILGDTPRLFPVLWGLWGYYVVKGDFRTALIVSEEALALAEGLEDVALQMEGFRDLGESQLWLGNFSKARIYLERALRLENEHSNLPATLPTFLQDHSPSVTARSSLSWVLWFLGYPAQALRIGKEALEVALSTNLPYNQGFSLMFAVVLHMLNRDSQSTHKLALKAVRLAREKGFAIIEAFGTFTFGWAISQIGRVDEGIKAMEASLEGFYQTGANHRSFFIGPLADTYNAHGDHDKALSLIDKELDLISTYGGRWWEADLYRVKGEVLAKEGEEEEALHCFERCLQVARRQKAASWELRGAMSYSKFLKSKGRFGEASSVLAPVYERFVRGNN